MSGEQDTMITPGIWGEPLWRVMHMFALAYPVSNPDKHTQDAYRDFFLSLKVIIPCEKCRNEYVRILEAMPLEPALRGGREALFRWTVDIHNSVAAKLGQGQMDPLYVRKTYIFQTPRSGPRGIPGAVALVLALVSALVASIVTIIVCSRSRAIHYSLSQ